MPETAHRPHRPHLPHHPLNALRAGAFSIGALLLLVGLGVLLGAPLLIPPLAASAALVHGAPRLPISQPRNVVGGHLVSAVVGFATLAVTGRTMWGAAVAGGIALITMMIARLPHSPAAATSVIVVLQGAHLLPFLPLLALATALLVLIGWLAGLLGPTAVRYPAAW
ncbi:HPP family protein [Kitasatospora viridis]|uniref:HPP family protein n=1 Tax=Kitasatospora viridis TaxID=281105 RepID=A0A561UHB6_9ACTN|nr:HPP family protein [Kitasatospora viridis]TWF98759.1 HPP family protein [Kitasatospora viridis]